MRYYEVRPRCGSIKVVEQVNWPNYRNGVEEDEEEEEEHQQQQPVSYTHLDVYKRQS